MNNWNAKNIKNLRLKLGWSTTGLARRLGCTSELVRKLEAGEAQADIEMQKQLNYLFFIKEECRKNLSETAAADAVLKENNLEQIDSKLVDKIKSD